MSRTERMTLAAAPAPTGETSSAMAAGGWRQVLADVGRIILGAAILLLVTSQCANLRRWHASALTDQVGYVGVARNLLDTGHLKTNLIYTSTLAQKAKRDYLYMPGHYLLLALSFRLTGVGPLQAALPSMIGYGVACACVYLTGRRLYGRPAGLFAAGIFGAFAPCLAYSFTALMEMTHLAAACFALCIFVHLPPRLRPYLGALLPAFPFLFRETGFLFIIPLAGLILDGIPFRDRIDPRRWRSAGLFCILAIVVLALVYLAPFSRQRISLNKVTVFDGGSFGFYHDATHLEQLPGGVIAWTKAIASNVVRNLRRLGELQVAQPYATETFGLTLLHLGMLLALARGWLHRDCRAFYAGLMALAAMILVLAVRVSNGFVGLRFQLIAAPFLAVVAGEWLRCLVKRQAPSPWRSRLVAAAALGLAGFSIALAWRFIATISRLDALDEESVATVEWIGHDPRRVLASPYDIGLPYAAYHYPVKWAFVPANPRTLSLLMKRYDVGTLIVPDDLLTLPREHIARAGFQLDRAIVWQGRAMHVYKAAERRTRRP